MAKNIPVNRKSKTSGREAMTLAAQYIREGVSVLFFPEATRKINLDEGPVGQFKPGAFKVAIETQAPVVPISISGARALLPPYGFPRLGCGRVKVKIHAPLPTTGMVLRDVRDSGSAVEADDLETLKATCRDLISSDMKDADTQDVLTDKYRSQFKREKQN